MEGTIKWYNPKNGYGFIAGEDGEDYFVHFTAVPQGIKIYPDDQVSFEAVETDKGKQAQNVQKIGEAVPKTDLKKALNLYRQRKILKLNQQQKIILNQVLKNQ